MDYSGVGAVELGTEAWLLCGGKSLLIKGKVSVLIPCRDSRYLAKTVNDVLSKSRGDIEVIVHLDGIWPDPLLKDDPRLVVIHRSVSMGMRAGIESAASIARGQYLLKTDDHCLFEEGFDEVLKADCEDDWVVVPRRDRLDAENWKKQENEKPPIDYHYLSWPYEKPDETGMHGTIWNQRAKERADILIDDEMSSQGSCWFMKKRHFRRIGGLPEEGYGNFVQEFQQIGNKTWLGGGRVVVNKKTTYLHWHKGKGAGRGYFISKNAMISGTHWSADYWINNRWPDRKCDIEWLIEKFNPPGWPADWQEQRHHYELGPDGLTRRKEMAA